MPELKLKAKLARNCTKCKHRASKFKILGEGSSYPPGGGQPLPVTYPNWALHAKMVALPPFLVPTIAIVIIVLVVSNLKKKTLLLPGPTLYFCIIIYFYVSS